MKVFTRFGTWSGAIVLLGAIASACGGGGETTTGTTSGTGGNGGATSSSSSSTTTSSSSGGTGGMGTGGMGTGGMGTGGMGGSTSGAHGPPASQLVNGGDVVKSPGYKMVFTLGQPTQNQSTTTSPGYRMQGGLIGANGTLP